MTGGLVTVSSKSVKDPGPKKVNGVRSPPKLKTTGKLWFQFNMSKSMKVTRLSQNSKYLLQTPGSSQHLSLPHSTRKLSSPWTSLSFPWLLLALFLILLVHLPSLVFSLVPISLLFLSWSDALASHSLVYSPSLVQSGLFQMPPAALSLISAI